MAEIEAIKAKIRRIPFIDPIDIRYRRFETVPKPVAQAVMFCLMDVSGSMTEHMKDLAKRFYMLLYVFLKRRYRHVEIVFIRHTDRAEEGRRADVLSRASFRRHAGVQCVTGNARYRAVAVPPGGLEHLRRAGVGRRQFLLADGEVASQLLTEMILPVTQFFAYLEVGPGERPVLRNASSSSLWTLYESLRASGAPLSMRKGQRSAARSSRCSTISSSAAASRKGSRHDRDRPTAV